MSEGSGAGAPGGPPPFRGSRRVAVRVHPLVSFNKGSSEVGGSDGNRVSPGRSSGPGAVVLVGQPRCAGG